MEGKGDAQEAFAGCSLWELRMFSPTSLLNAGWSICSLALPETTMSSDKSSDAASSIAGILPQVAGAAAGLTVLGVFAGWKEASAYYAELGASWFLGTITPTMLLERSANTMLTLALFAIISISQHMQGKASAKGLRSASIFAVVASSALFIVGLLPESLISLTTAHLCTAIGSIALSISAGLTIGEISARLTDDELKWNGYHIWLLYFVVWFGLMQAPSQVGASQGKLDRDARTSSLPTAQIIGSPGKQLRLVTLVGSQALLVDLADQPSQNKFRVVEVGSVVIVGKPQPTPVRP